MLYNNTVFRIKSPHRALSNPQKTTASGFQVSTCSDGSVRVKVEGFREHFDGSFPARAPLKQFEGDFML